MRNIIANKRIEAEEALKLFNIPMKAPIDITPIIRELNIMIKKDLDRDNLHNIGYIKVKDNDIIIWLNPFKNIYETRERFTIAHELGHLFLHIAPENINAEFEDTEENLNRNNYWNIKEYEANNFAARLLMPKELIKEHVLKIYNDYVEKYKTPPTKDELVTMMADIFNVSKKAMEFRLKNTRVIR